MGLPTFILGLIKNHENFAFRIWNRVRFFFTATESHASPKITQIEKRESLEIFLKVIYHWP
jgi:hypothetical protein